MQIKGWKEIYGKVEKGNLRIDWLQLLSEGGCQVFFFRVCFFFFFLLQEVICSAHRAFVEKGVLTEWVMLLLCAAQAAGRSLHHRQLWLLESKRSAPSSGLRGGGCRAAAVLAFNGRRAWSWDFVLRLQKAVLGPLFLVQLRGPRLICHARQPGPGPALAAPGRMRRAHWGACFHAPSTTASGMTRWHWPMTFSTTCR
jgi:hypothetical protein